MDDVQFPRVRSLQLLFLRSDGCQKLFHSLLVVCISSDFYNGYEISVPTIHHWLWGNELLRPAERICLMSRCKSLRKKKISSTELNSLPWTVRSDLHCSETRLSPTRHFLCDSLSLPGERCVRWSNTEERRRRRTWVWDIDRSLVTWRCSLATLIHNCSKLFTWKFSKPDISKMEQVR